MSDNAKKVFRAIGGGVHSIDNLSKLFGITKNFIADIIYFELLEYVDKNSVNEWTIIEELKDVLH